MILDHIAQAWVLASMIGTVNDTVDFKSLIGESWESNFTIRAPKQQHQQHGGFFLMNTYKKIMSGDILRKSRRQERKTAENKHSRTIIHNFGY